MEIRIKKLELIEWLITINDERALDMVDELRKKISKTDSASIKRKTIEELLNELETSDADFKGGNAISIEELELEIKNW